MRLWALRDLMSLRVLMSVPFFMRAALPRARPLLREGGVSVAPSPAECTSTVILQAFRAKGTPRSVVSMQALMDDRG